MSPRFAAALFLLPTLAVAQATGAQEPPAPPEESRPTAGSDIAAHAPELPFLATVMKDDAGMKLMVNGQPFLVVGMNWDYIPVGFNYRYNLFAQPEDVIVAALDREMGLMKRMGVNAVRMYVGIPAKWIRYIHEKYGIYTVLNPVVGRYGVTMGGTYNPNTNYADPATRAFLKDEVLTLVREYRNTPGLLMWLLGNENNYGLSWRSFEIEALPQGERDTAKAKYLYSLFGEILREVKKEDPTRPVAIANGDVQYIDLIAQECQGLDVFGTNVYRGYSARDLFQVVKQKLGVPVMFTEFGADAYDAKAQQEADVVQAKYLLAQWQEIYEQSYGKGRDGSAIGGFVFQWSDGWWKHGQESNLDVHDTTATWPNAGYAEDFVAGQNNMNEEWWGICAKGRPDERGLYVLYPRTAYYVLQAAVKLPAYAPTTTLETIRAHFAPIDPAAEAYRYEAQSVAAGVRSLERVRVTSLRMNLEMYSTGGARAASPATQQPFDHMESFFASVQARPVPQLTADVAVNVLGNVARNPLDQIFYEARGRPVSVTGSDGVGIILDGQERLKIYGARVVWDEPRFNLTGFFRTGHYHWGYEGDFFGLYREANYGTSIDVYDADVPLGVEFSGKRELEGLKIAAGPQLWWGANPSVMAKYTRRFGLFDVTVVDEEQFARLGGTTTSAAIPQPQTRKTALAVATRLGGLGVEAGALWAGSPLVGRRFRYYGEGQRMLEDAVLWTDTLGGKLKVTYEAGRFHWYAQGAYMGLVAEAGPTSALTFTGWHLKDSGSGNQVNAMTGVAIDLTPFQIAPNVLWQRPLVGPGPSISGQSALRNILQDPFVVRANRELLGAELLINFDPTPATFLYNWDSELTEDAPLAGSLNFIYRHQPTSLDAGIGILADGTMFAFPGATPPRDLYEVQARLISHPAPDLRILGRLYAGTGEPTGDSQRVAHRYGGDLRVAWKSAVLAAYAKFNDWGPYDYHRDYNLTFPLQLMGDAAYTLGAPRWLGLAQTRIGVRGTLRYLNGFSPNFAPDAQDRRRWGNEWELRSYLSVAL